MSDLLALLTHVFDMAIAIHQRAPAQFWALVGCWFGGILLTQQLKLLVRPRWSDRKKQLVSFAAGFTFGALIPWALWPPAPWRVQLAVALLGGLAATSAYAISVRVLGMFWPGVRRALSVNGTQEGDGHGR